MDLNKLKELKELLDSGAITESEYDDLKKKIISDVKAESNEKAQDKLVTIDSTKRPSSIVLIAIILFLGVIGSVVGFIVEHDNHSDSFNQYKYILSVFTYLWLGIALLKGDKYVRLSLNLLMAGEILYSVRALLGIRFDYISGADIVFLFLLFGIPTLVLILINSKLTVNWLKNYKFENRRTFIAKVLPFHLLLLFCLFRLSYYFIFTELVPITVCLFSIIFLSSSIKRNEDLSEKLGNQAIFLLVSFCLLFILRLLFIPFYFRIDILFIVAILALVIFLIILLQDKVKFQRKLNLHADIILLSKLLMTISFLL